MHLATWGVAEFNKPEEVCLTSLGAELGETNDIVLQSEEMNTR
jgi:hypothetical protein